MWSRIIRAREGGGLVVWTLKRTLIIHSTCQISKSISLMILSLLEGQDWSKVSVLAV